MASERGTYFEVELHSGRFFGYRVETWIVSGPRRDLFAFYWRLTSRSAHRRLMIERRFAAYVAQAIRGEIS